MKPLLCLVGPTASGKTALAVTLAQTFGMEIVTCDSMQVYKEMDIGTAKPDMTERGGIPHHMLDVAEPHENYNAARYAHDADIVLRSLAGRSAVPLVTGGTGLYLRALVRPMHSVDVGELVSEKPNDELHKELTDIDPETAARVSPGDRRRILRALAVYQETGLPLSEHHRRSVSQPPRYETLVLGLTFADRQTLYKRVDRRVDIMLEAGLRDEVRHLLDGGLPESCTAMQAIGYKEMAEHLRGGCTLDDAAEKIRLNTRHLAKRQLTWFTRQEEVCWFEAEDKALTERILEFVGKKFLHPG